VKINDELTEHKLEPDDGFEKSIIHFANCIKNANMWAYCYREIIKQAELMHKFKEMSE